MNGPTPENLIRHVEECFARGEKVVSVRGNASLIRPLVEHYGGRCRLDFDEIIIFKGAKEEA